MDLGVNAVLLLNGSGQRERGLGQFSGWAATCPQIDRITRPLSLARSVLILAVPRTVSGMSGWLGLGALGVRERDTPGVVDSELSAAAASRQLALKAT